MSKRRTIMKTALAGLLATVLAGEALAAFTLNGTRFIYEEGKKSISLEVSNSTDETYGGQVWIDNVSHSRDDVFIVPSPPFFKVDAKGKQIVRLMNANPALPKDRESLFWLNVQEVPPKPKSSEGSQLAIAMNTQVKLIYRPKVLSEGRKDAEKQLTFIGRDGTVWLKNPTPYYFAVTSVFSGGREVTLSKEAQKSLSLLAPYSEVNTGVKSLSGKLSVEAINDWGGVQRHEIK